MNGIRRILSVTFALAVLAAPAAAADKKEKKPMADQFTGTLVAMTGTAGGMGQRVTIWIDAYTADADAQAIKKTLVEGGQAALRNALPNYEAGRIRIGTNNSYPLSIARQRVASDGRVILLATNAPLTGFQANSGARSEDYPVGFIELKLKADGTGEGTIIAMAQVSIDESNNLKIASYGAQPSRLMNVETAKKN